MCVVILLTFAWWLSASWLESIAQDLKVQVEARKPSPSLLHRLFEQCFQRLWPPPAPTHVRVLPLFGRHVIATMEIIRLKEELRQPGCRFPWVLFDFSVGSVLAAPLLVRLIRSREKGLYHHYPLKSVHRAYSKASKSRDAELFLQKRDRNINDNRSYLKGGQNHGNDFSYRVGFPHLKGCSLHENRPYFNDPLFPLEANPHRPHPDAVPCCLEDRPFGRNHILGPSLQDDITHSPNTEDDLSTNENIFRPNGSLSCHENSRNSLHSDDYPSLREDSPHTLNPSNGQFHTKDTQYPDDDPSPHSSEPRLTEYPSPPHEMETQSPNQAGMASEHSLPFYESDQDAVDSFLREAGLCSFHFPFLPLPLLRSSDRRDILDQRWLSDDVIDLAQDLLQRQYPEIRGLYACGAAFTLPPLQPGSTSLFLQVLNRSAPQCLASMAEYGRPAGTHWLLLSSYGAERSGQLVVYDSLYDSLSATTTALVEQLQELYVPPPGAVLRSVQRQQDDYSCGLFALAFAFSIVFGEDPCSVRYDRANMAPHLVWCLEHGIVQLFPS